MTTETFEDHEPFLLKLKTQSETVEYEAGLNAGLMGEPSDDTMSEAWQRGWAEAQE